MNKVSLLNIFLTRWSRTLELTVQYFTKVPALPGSRVFNLIKNRPMWIEVVHLILYVYNTGAKLVRKQAIKQCLISTNSTKINIIKNPSWLVFYSLFPLKFWWSKIIKLPVVIAFGVLFGPESVYFGDLRAHFWPASACVVKYEWPIDLNNTAISISFASN